MKIIRTDSRNQDFIKLVKNLDAYLTEKDVDEHPFYDQYNKVDQIKYVVLAYENGKAIACGAIKEYQPTIMELKRMYTDPECRGKGAAGKVLAELELWAAELSFKKCILETGKRQVEAVVFYKKKGYRPIPNYGQYAKTENSLCFEKEIR